MSAEDIESIKDQIAYNSHDLGDFGKMIRLEYVFHILDSLTPKLASQDEKIAAISLLLADAIELYETAGDEICPNFLRYLVDHSVSPEVLVEVVKVLADVHG